MIVLPLEVDAAPRFVLVHWRAWEVQVPHYDAPSWHLVGSVSGEHSVKVSSALAQVTADGGGARSKTGSLYTLSGAPGHDESAARLWASWQRQHGVVVLRDVSAELRAGRQPRQVRLIRRTAAVEDPASSLRGHRQ
ncbi:hypothetical protein ACG02S_00285 [Roseateles sp. DC23W]|uniref:Uncharacterized protein n=1 Tax=Pelomonas dachongensis TaxID=3299029 RepID=A0ABW7EJ40_9BURK